MPWTLTFADQSLELKKLYATPLIDELRITPNNSGFLAVNALERSIANITSQLGGHLLDVGCGEQPYRIYLKSYCQTIDACDFDESKPNITFACPAHRIPQANARYDSLLCTEVLEHVPEPNLVLEEFRRVLKPGGKLLISVPCYWPPHELPYDYFRYPAHGLIALLERNGFVIDRFIPRGGQWAFLGQVLSHTCNHYLREGILQILVNRIFQGLDKWRLNPSISLGWTVLAYKSPKIQ